MFDFIRDLRKTDEERRQENLTAYLDGALTPEEQRRFEQRLTDDATLSSELAQYRWIKENVGRLPRLRAPRHFTLDPALYGRPQPDLLIRLYPALRTTTLVATVIFIVALVVQLIIPGSGQQGATDQASEIALETEPLLQESELPEAEEVMAAPAEAMVAPAEVQLEAEAETAASDEESTGAAVTDAQRAEEPVATESEEEVVAEEMETTDMVEALPPVASKIAEEEGIEEAEPAAQLMQTAPVESQPAPAASGVGEDRGEVGEETEGLLPEPAVTPTAIDTKAEESLAEELPTEPGEIVPTVETMVTGRPEDRSTISADEGLTAIEEPQLLQTTSFELVIGLGVLVVFLAIATFVIGRRRI